MIFSNANKSIVRSRYESILALSFICLLLFDGCSSLSSKNKKSDNLSIQISDPAKKVGIAMVKNITSFKDRSYEKIFQGYLIEAVTDLCSNTLFVKPGDAKFPDFLVDLPRNEKGNIDNHTLTQLGRQAGMNTIVAAEIMGITGKEEKRGILLFKDLHQFIYIQVKVEVYDTQSGVKLVDERYSEEIEIDELELELYKKKEVVSRSEVDDAFLKISEDTGEKICDAVRINPWRGYITSVNGNRILISSGEEVGLVPGAILEVYTAGEIIQGVDGHQFRMPGRKTGEVELTAVYADTCEAVFYSGNDILEGYSVTFKH
ncbi:MAG: hypothetical protein HKO79_01415 [Desulfobacterales bacterium]|nr:hypothetical protein [Deltaproteobacteria bacterium]NNL41133.1 hypothetical protein [Desulfobacterales bacterium]